MMAKNGEKLHSLETEREHRDEIQSDNRERKWTPGGREARGPCRSFAVRSGLHLHSSPPLMAPGLWAELPSSLFLTYITSGGGGDDRTYHKGLFMQLILTECLLGAR